MSRRETNIDQRKHARFSALVRKFEPSARLVDHWSLAGGVSAQTTGLLIERPSGERLRYVVREHGDRDLARDPDIARHEYQLLAALWDAGLPVPRPVYVRDAEDPFNRAAIVLEFVDGEIVTDPPRPARYIAELARWLGVIHGFDLNSTELSFLVADHTDVAPRLERRPGDSQLVEQIREALRKAGTVAFTNEPVLLHGDFWPGNLLWKNGQLVAIIDWEDASIGDPVVDLARSRLEIHWTLGPMSCERFTSQYLSYRDIDVDNLAYWELRQALGFARALPDWGLPEARERELEAALSVFVQEAREKIQVDRA